MKKLQLTGLIILLAGTIGSISAQAKYNSASSPFSHQARFSVYDYTTKAPISHAAIVNAEGLELGYTNVEGNLALNLPPDPSDYYTIKASGFNNLNIRLTQAEKKSGDYEVFLPALSTEDPLETALASSNETMMPEVKPEMIKVYVKQDPASYVKQNDDLTSVDFSVQVTASSKPISEKSARKEWEGLGPVYVQTENGMYKIRIGPYQSQQEAKQVLLEAKSKGRKDAFIVVRQGGANDKPINKPATVVAKNDLPVVKENDTNASIPGQEYKVRIASYLQPGGFNPEGVDQLGPLESYRKGEWTIMMIGGFRSLEAAKAARNVVISKGFNDAAVVVDHNGVIETIVE